MLTSFWFIFERASEQSVLDMGAGVTAYDLADAKKLLEAQVFPLFGERPVESIITDVDIRTLEDKHVRPNMGNPAVRGVWYPQVAQTLRPFAYD